MDELQEVLSEAEDPYFELKNGDLRAVERLFRHAGVLAQLRFLLDFGRKNARKASFYSAKLDMDDGQLLAKDERCATSGSKDKTRTIKELFISAKLGLDYGQLLAKDERLAKNCLQKTFLFQRSKV